MRLGRYNIGPHVGVGRRRYGGGGGSTALPLNLRLILVGDSITNVSNAAYSSHRAYRHWLNFYSKGHFYCTPGSNQGIGGAVLCAATDATKYIGLRKNHWLNQTDANTAVMFAIGTNDGPTPTLQNMKDTLAAHIAEVRALGGRVFVCALAKSTNNQTAGANLTRWNDWNAHIATLHDPANGIYALTSRATALPNTTTTYLYDGLHFTGEGARLVGAADAADLAPYLATGSILFGASAPPENLEANWDLSGTAGTAGTGTSGQVATGWSAYCSTTGAAGGSTIGVTATCTKTTVDIPGVGTGLPAQQIDILGTASGAGVLTLINTVTVNAQYDDLAEGFAYVAISGSDQANPVGASSIGCLLGSMGGMFSKTVDANAGDLVTAVTGLVRTVPVANLQNNNTANFEFSIGIKAGTVNIRLIVAQMGARLVETAAYMLPFNVASAMPSSLVNPIGDRPKLNGTVTVGNTVTIQPGTWQGGAVSRQILLKRNGTTIVTKNPGDTPMTYTVQAGDAGTTLTLEDTGTNSFGAVTSTSVNYAVP